MINRQQRSRWLNYREQIDALGLSRWLRFKVQRLRLRLASAGTEFNVTTPLAQYPVAIRANTSDTNVFSQIFLHREYRCLDDVQDVSLIIDCGANVGYASAYLLSRFPSAQVIAIEPDPGNFRMLQQNVQPYGSRCTTLQAGVWSSPVKLIAEEVHPGRRNEWSVSVRPAQAHEEASVAGVDLESVLLESGHDRISILKVDIEGSEAAVFGENTEAWLGRVDTIVIELHGSRCRDVFFAAIDGLGYEVSQCEELTVCKKSALTSSD